MAAGSTSTPRPSAAVVWLSRQTHKDAKHAAYLSADRHPRACTSIAHEYCSSPDDVAPTRMP